MPIDLAEHFISKFSNDEISDCLGYTVRLISQIQLGYGLSEPYYLFLDNDVLNALRKPNQYKIRYVALIAVFKALNHHHSEFKVAINPAIFFEFNRSSVLTSERDFDNGWYQLIRSVNPLGVECCSVGLKTLSEAKLAYKAIENDKGHILKVLNDIKSKDWFVELETQNGIKLPHAVANEYLSELECSLLYFDSFMTGLYLQSVIVSKILHNKRNSSYARKSMRDPYAIKMSKLLEGKKDKLTGRGDLSLLALCDISSQFKFSTKSTNIALTFDKRLESILIDKSKRIVSTTINGDDTEDTKLEKRNRFEEESQRMEQSTEESFRFVGEMISLLNKVEWFNEAIR